MFPQRFQDSAADSEAAGPDVSDMGLLKGAHRVSSAKAQRYSDLPLSYHRWKWRIRLSFSGFYFFFCLGRFNFWPVAPLVEEDLELSHLEIGLVTVLLLWGIRLGALLHGRLRVFYGL